MKDVFQNVKLDFRSSVPIYMQIVEQVQQKVAVGELKKYDQLPTVRQLATELRVNFNTVARAYRILDELASYPPSAVEEHISGKNRMKLLCIIYAP